MFRICDSQTGEVIYETNNIQELSDYLYNTDPKYIAVTVNKKYIKK
jgi:hypothetical protein